jgi:LmbE family N-acetylglucosaminyl deacetylase
MNMLVANHTKPDTGLKVLVLAAHTDDAELGMGPIIAKHIKDGDKVKIVSFSSIPESLPIEDREPNQLVKEHACAMEVFGVTDWIVLKVPGRIMNRYDAEIRHIIYNLVNKCYKPDRVYTPCKNSEHQDHQVIYNCTRNVLSKSHVSFWTYSLPGDSKAFSPNIIVPLDYQKHIEPYIKAVNAYTSQYKRRWWDADVFVARALYWSPYRSGTKWSWAFEVEKV